MDQSNGSGNNENVLVITGRRRIPVKNISPEEWYNILNVALYATDLPSFSGLKPLKDFLNSEIYGGKRETNELSKVTFPKRIDKDSRCLRIAYLSTEKIKSHNKCRLLLITKKRDWLLWEYLYKEVSQGHQCYEVVISAEFKILSQQELITILKDAPIPPDHSNERPLGGRILGELREITKKNLADRKERLSAAEKSALIIEGIDERIRYN